MSCISSSLRRRLHCATADQLLERWRRWQRLGEPTRLEQRLFDRPLVPFKRHCRYLSLAHGSRAALNPSLVCCRRHWALVPRRLRVALLGLPFLPRPPLARLVRAAALPVAGVRGVHCETHRPRARHPVPAPLRPRLPSLRPGDVLARRGRRHLPGDARCHAPGECGWCGVTPPPPHLVASSRRMPSPREILQLWLPCEPATPLPSRASPLSLRQSAAGAAAATPSRWRLLWPLPPTPAASPSNLLRPRAGSGSGP